MTMRQVAGLLKVINRSDLTEFYMSILSYRAYQGEKLPSLNEFLDLSLKDKNKEENPFDESTDKLFEAHALKLLEERRKLSEQRLTDKN